MFEKIRQFLYRPVDAASLAMFRILFGGVMVGEMLYYASTRERHFPDEGFRPTWELLEFTQDWGRGDLDMLLPALAIPALGLCLGLLTRWCAVVFFVGYTWVFISDPTHFNNHYYLISLLSFWFIWVRTDSCWSVDSLVSKSKRSDTVPQWHTWLFRAHLCMVYFYGGLAKLKWDWLQGEPMRAWANIEKDRPIVGSFLGTHEAGYFFAWGGLVFDLAIPFLLLWRRTRLFAIVLAAAFHFTNVWLFNIGVFPWLMIATSVLFLENSTPRRWFGGSGDRSEGLEVPAVSSKQKLVTTLLMTYTVIQLLMPFRHWLYSGNPEWNEEGKAFSWRMMLSHKYTFAHVVAYGEDGSVWMVDQTKHLHPRQFRGKGVWGNPRRLAQYARFVRKLAIERGMKSPVVRVDAVASLNGRPFQYLVDPDIDLGTAPVPLIGTPDWVRQLEPDQPIGNYLMDRGEQFKAVREVILSHHATSPPTAADSAVDRAAYAHINAVLRGR